ncbi:DNA cytosine methyltransferase [Desulfonatronum thiodismutans]|uniref:DNA cytosine methyltransferase n=1 Tax=Desulfonatronum thiodismutans TaxID=159290 RepID=UPI00068A4B6B|nr:DNA (cytosine-5-)-methyltransferase [Desulfonatronum thiodismutans]
MIHEKLGCSEQARQKHLRSKTVAEYFAGIGLMRLGLEKEGWSVVFANDIDPDKHRMYQSNFDDAPGRLSLEDVHLLSPEDTPTTTLATASFPCNDLSLAGMRKGLVGKQSSAYWGFIRILETMGERRPPIVLLENVAGFLTSHQGRDFQAALLALNRLGYAVDAMIVDAARFVPQSRVRLFVVGKLRQGASGWRLNESLRFYESDVRPKALADFILMHPEIVWDLRKMPTLPRTRLRLSDIVEELPAESPFWWNEQRRDYLLSQMSEKHAQQVAVMKQRREWSYGTVFRRVRKGRSMAELRTDGVAGCLRTPRGGSGRQILLRAGYDQVDVRLLTPRECAKLMGADDFVIDVPLNQAFFGFGDAVCVPVISWIAKNYLNPLVEEMLADTSANPSPQAADIEYGQVQESTK